MPDLYIHLDGRQAGPFSPDQLRTMLAAGTITGETLAWHEGMTAWSTVAALLAATPVGPTRPVFVQQQASSGMNSCFIVAFIFSGLMVVLMAGSVVFALYFAPKINEQVQQRVAMDRLAKNGSSAAEAEETTRTVQTGYLADVLNRYATEHGGAYPDGKTSTEVFQQLLDQKYVYDPTVFYFPLKGKTKPAGPKLTAGNVCFDVTAGGTSKSTKFLPIVFTTGFDVAYAPGASAAADPSVPDGAKAMAVTYLNGTSRYITRAAQGSAPGFIDSGFDAGGETYRQLKP